MDAPTYYALLGVSATASIREIKQTYRRLARAYHPDLHPDSHDTAARFTAIAAAAAAVLTDPDQRATYDTQLATYPARAAVSRDMRSDGYDVAYAVTVSHAEAAHGTQRAPGVSSIRWSAVSDPGGRAGGEPRGNPHPPGGPGRPAFSGPGRGDLYVTIQIAEERGA
jgi:DnaJ-class molecular chaperone